MRAEAKEKAEATPWTDKEKALLIQAVKMFPGGTINRWSRIAEHVNAHSGQEARPEKEVINEAKNILKGTKVDALASDPQSHMNRYRTRPRCRHQG